MYSVPWLCKLNTGSFDGVQKVIRRALMDMGLGNWKGFELKGFSSSNDDEGGLNLVTAESLR